MLLSVCTRSGERREFEAFFLEDEGRIMKLGRCNWVGWEDVRTSANNLGTVTKGQVAFKSIQWCGCEAGVHRHLIKMD